MEEDDDNLRPASAILADMMKNAASKKRSSAHASPSIMERFFSSVFKKKKKKKGTNTYETITYCPADPEAKPNLDEYKGKLPDAKKFSCPHCDRHFCRQLELSNHIKIHDEAKVKVIRHDRYFIFEHDNNCDSDSDYSDCDRSDMSIPLALARRLKDDDVDDDNPVFSADKLYFQLCGVLLIRSIIFTILVQKTPSTCLKRCLVSWPVERVRRQMRTSLPVLGALSKTGRS